MSERRKGSLSKRGSQSHIVASQLHLGGLAHTNAHELHQEDTHLKEHQREELLEEMEKLNEVSPPINSINSDFTLWGPGMKYFGYIAGFLPLPMPPHLRWLGMAYPGFVLLSMVSRIVWELQNLDNKYVSERPAIVAIMLVSIIIFVGVSWIIVLHGIPQRAVQALHKQVHSYEIFTHIVDNDIEMDEKHHRSLDMRAVRIRSVGSAEEALFDNKQEIKDFLEGKQSEFLTEDVEVRQGVRKISHSHTLFAVCTLLPVLALQNVPIISEWIGDDDVSNDSVGLESVYARLGFLYSNLTLLMSPIYGFTLVTMCLNLFYLRVKNALEIVDNLSKKRLSTEYLDWVEAMRVAIHHHYKHFRPIVIRGLILCLGLAGVHATIYMIILFIAKGKYPSIWVFMLPAVVYYLVATLYAVGHKFVRSLIQLDNHVAKLIHKRNTSAKRKRKVKSSGYGVVTPKHKKDDSVGDKEKLLNNSQEPTLEMSGMSKAHLDNIPSKKEEEEVTEKSKKSGSRPSTSRKVKRRSSKGKVGTQSARGSKSGRKNSIGKKGKKKKVSKKNDDKVKASDGEESVSLRDPKERRSSKSNVSKVAATSSTTNIVSSSPKHGPSNPSSNKSSSSPKHGPTSHDSTRSESSDDEVKVPRGSALRLHTFTETAKVKVHRHPAIGLYYTIVRRSMVLVAGFLLLLMIRLFSEFPDCLDVQDNPFETWSRAGCSKTWRAILLSFRSLFAMGIPAISPFITFIFMCPHYWRQKRILYVVAVAYVIPVLAGFYVFIIDTERHDSWPAIISNGCYILLSIYLGFEVDWHVPRTDHHRWNFTFCFLASAVGAAGARFLQGGVIIPYYINASASGKIIVVLLLQPLCMFVLVHFFKEMAERIEELPHIEHHHGKATALLLIPQLLVAFAGRLYLINLKSLKLQLQAACVAGLIEYANRLMAPLEFYIIWLVATRSRESAWKISEYVRMNDVHRDALYVGIISEIMAIVAAPILSIVVKWHFDLTIPPWENLVLSVLAQLAVEFATDIAALIMEEAYLGRKIVELFGKLHKEYHYLKVSLLLTSAIIYIAGRDYYLLIHFADTKK